MMWGPSITEGALLPMRARGTQHANLCTPGYVRLLDARDELAGRMYEGVPDSEELEALRHEGLRVIDRARCKIAASELRRAIRDGQLHVYAHQSSRDLPSRLDQQIYEVAFTFEPSNKDRLPKECVDRVTGAHILTLVYLDRLPGAPFGLTWPELRELMRAPLYLEEQEFRAWLRSEVQKKAWPCHEQQPKSGLVAIAPKEASSRRRSVESEAMLKNRIESVLTAARRRWPNKGKRPPWRTMAKMLFEDRGGLGYSEAALRQILRGTYVPMRRLGISGLAG